MKLRSLKRPRNAIALALVVVLLVATGTLFHPAFQRKMVLEHVAPLTDSLSLEFIHITPWSVAMDSLKLSYAGGQFSLPETRLSFCVSSLLFGNANVKLLTVRGAEIDLSEFKTPPSEPTDTVFPGLLNALELGLGFILESADVSATLVLPNQQRVDFTLSGGNIQPDATGSLKLRGRFDGGDNFGTVTSDATVSFAQLSGGRFASLRV